MAEITANLSPLYLILTFIHLSLNRTVLILPFITDALFSESVNFTTSLFLKYIGSKVIFHLSSRYVIFPSLLLYFGSDMSLSLEHDVNVY